MLTVPIRCLAQDLQELVGYQATMDPMDSLVSRAQKAKEEQLAREEKWVMGQFCPSSPVFLFSMTVFRWVALGSPMWRQSTSCSALGADATPVSKLPC